MNWSLNINKKHISWKNRTKEAKGGNTDCIFQMAAVFLVMSSIVWK